MKRKFLLMKRQKKQHKLFLLNTNLVLQNKSYPDPFSLDAGWEGESREIPS